MSIELTLFLLLNGKAKEAIHFYEKYLGAKIQFMINYKEFKKIDDSFVYDESKAEYISHSVLKIGKSILMIVDESTEKIITGTNFSLCIQSDSKEEIENIYHSITKDKNVKIIMPLESNAFSHAYAIIRDPFGITIQLLNEKSDEFENNF